MTIAVISENGENDRVTQYEDKGERRQRDGSVVFVTVSSSNGKKALSKIAELYNAI